jgi:hypothetical protein
MAKEVLLVSETKLKAFTSVNQNVDSAIMVSNIFIAQEVHLQPVIGTKGYQYYQNLVRDVQLSGGTMSQPDKILLEDYIAPVCIHSAYFEALPDIWVRNMNKGLIQGNSEQGTGVEIKTMTYFRGIAQSRYQFYLQRLQDYIQSHSGDYPWYFSWSDKDGMPSENTNYFSGIYLGGGMRKPPRKDSWYNNLPAYYGGTWDCNDCGY